MVGGEWIRRKLLPFFPSDRSLNLIPPFTYISPLHFRSATDFEGGAFRLLSGGGAAASLAEPDAGNTLSPSKREQRRQMAEALLGAEPDAQG